MIDQVFTRDEALVVLRDLDFFKRRPADDGWTSFLAQVRARPAPELSATVVVPELLDSSESIPVANLSVDTVVQLHDYRHRRYLSRQRQRGN